MSGSDRRIDFRAELRTVVNIYTEESRQADPPEFTRGWSEDVSSTGAKITTIDPIQGSRIWLKFLAQGQDQCIIEAEIVRAGTFPRSQFRQNDLMHSYGVRFSQLISEKDFLELSLDQVERTTANFVAAAPSSPAKAHS